MSDTERRPYDRFIEESARRREQAHELRLRGLTFQQIGDEMGVSRQAASALWRKYQAKATTA